MSLRALIFDVDGTLADTEDLHRQAFNAAFAKHGLGWYWGRRVYCDLLRIAGGQERLARFIELTEVPLADKMLLREQIPTIHAAKTAFYSQYLATGCVQLRDGVEPLIAQARHARLKLAIASTTTRANIEFLLHYVFSRQTRDVFDLIASGDSAPKKPAPAIYDFVLDRLGLRAIDALAIEDSANGLASAKGADLCTLVTPTFWTECEDFSTADAVLPTLAGFDLEHLSAIHSRSLLRHKEVA
jgi:HAD superfamily hydrolase (TIGR01509 family)